MSETSAPLLAYQVAVCCQRVLFNITEQRREVLEAIVHSKPGAASIRFEDAVSRLPDHERMIPQMLRYDEEQRLLKMLELAQTIEGVPGIRMEVSLSDFQWIKREYKTLSMR